MSPTPVQITRRPETVAAPMSVVPQARRPEPSGIVITTVDQVAAGPSRNRRVMRRSGIDDRDATRAAQHAVQAGVAEPAAAGPPGYGAAPAA